MSTYKVVVFKDADIYVAQCLELDIVSQGSTADEALSRLQAVFKCELAEVETLGTSISDLGAAPEAFLALHDAEEIQRSALVA